MKYFLSADYHFGHYNIIKYANRPFKTLNEMNEKIIKRHNERVKPEDIVFFVGDFCFKSKSNRGEGAEFKSEYYIKQLNGKIIFIRGNHDNNNSMNTHIEKLIFKCDNREVCMVHRPEDADYRYSINFVGHVHHLWKFKRIRTGETFTDLINVGCDVWNFYPQTFQELMRAYKIWIKKNEIL